MRHLFTFMVSVFCLVLGSSLQAQQPIIAKQDFDDPVNLLNETAFPALNSFSNLGDQWGIYNESTVTSFGLRDDSGTECEGTARFFAGDTQGFIGCGPTTNFFGATDLNNSDNTGGTGTASWDFDISGASNLSVSIDVAAMGDFEGTDELDFTYSIDFGPAMPLFTSFVNDAISQMYTMDDGDVVTINDPILLDGTLLNEDFQTFTAGIAGTGSVLTITVNAANNSDNEAFAFDNICVRGDAGCNEIFISEYTEGSSLDKCLELYNPTGGPINLTVGEYQLLFFFNGSTSAGTTINLSGVIPAGGTFVVCDDGASADYLAQADQTSNSNFYNGDDAIELQKGGTVIDAFGQKGTDPGSAWGAGNTSTQNNTLIRKAGITMGDPISTDAFDPADEWEGTGDDSPDNLGTHTSNCIGGPLCRITDIYLTNYLGCNNNGTPESDDDFFAAEIVVEYQDAPASGNLVITGDILFPPSGEIVIPVSELTGSPFLINETFTGYSAGIASAADGMLVSLTATFSDEPSCTLTNPAAGQAFPSCSAPACTPVINEIDYDNPGTDDREFVEIYNPCDEPINLGDYRLVFVNGSNGSTYQDFQLPEVDLGPGEFFVVCSSANTVPNCAMQVSPATNLIQNGSPDAVALFFGDSPADVVSYEGDVAGFVEGSGNGLFDTGAPGVGIGRLPDGSDSNQNNADFSQQCITPGAPNTSVAQFCSLPPGFSVDNVGCNGVIDAEYDSNSGTFSLVTSCYNYGIGNFDRFNFVSQEVCGDVEISARIADVLPSSGYAGIMMRESIAPGSKMISIIRFPDGQKRIVYRTMTNGNFQIAASPGVTSAFDYVRIVRQGQNFLCYASLTGAPGSWLLIYANFIPMNSCIRAGLTASSFAEGGITIAEFDNVIITSNGMLPVVAEQQDELRGVQAKSQQLSELPQLPTAETALGFGIFPNPVYSELSIVIDQQDRVDEAIVSILSMEGKEVYRSIHEVDGNTIRLPLDGLNMPAGMYILSLNTGEAIVTERFVKAGGQ